MKVRGGWGRRVWIQHHPIACCSLYSLNVPSLASGCLSLLCALTSRGQVTDGSHTSVRSFWSLIADAPAVCPSELCLSSPADSVPKQVSALLCATQC